MSGEGTSANGGRMRAMDVCWDGFDESQESVTDEMVQKVANMKGKFKYSQTDGLFNKVLRDVGKNDDRPV